MAPFLFTAEQLRSNIQVFQLHSGAPKANVNLPLLAARTGEVVSRASALHLPEGTASSAEETFRDPKFHLDVVSTFLATSMQAINYVPNGSYEGVMDAEKEAKAFTDLLSNLIKFGSYLPLIKSLKNEFDYPEEDCKALLGIVQSFVMESGIESSTIVTRNLLVESASLTSSKKAPTLFVAFHFQGGESNPSLYIFYGTANMLRTKTGKSVATAKQSIQVGFYQYQLNSKLVSDMAPALAITVVPAEKLTKYINNRFLLQSE